ncbi:DUF6758 family protein [Nocardioides sp.]|uniref:DUF6758 family protein n=1 Tax=Nocardioides sp. TaxID=35761 RepID=UPI003568FF74
MPLTPGCPRCPTPGVEDGSRWSCPEHGTLAPLWRPGEASYEGFVEHLGIAAEVPTYVPWPLSPGWRVTDFAAVADRAAMTCVAGASELDGPVEVIMVAEEPGTGLGARLAGTRHDDPGEDLGQGPPTTRVRIESQTVPLWPVSVNLDGGEWDRSVLAGEARGRWLWIVVRPASAVLLLQDPWILRDVSDLGPALVEVPFGGPAPTW